MASEKRRFFFLSGHVSDRSRLCITCHSIYESLHASIYSFIQALIHRLVGNLLFMELALGEELKGPTRTHAYTAQIAGYCCLLQTVLCFAWLAGL